MKKLNFIKEYNKWFIDLPEWTGEKDDLEMVCGADDLLEYLSNGNEKISLNIKLNYFENYRYKLEYKYSENEGAWYSVENRDYEHIIDIWICKVTEYVFGYFPKQFFI